MAAQHNYAAFNLPAPLISGFHYGVHNNKRVEFKVPSSINVDTGEVEPSIPAFGNGGPTHKCIVTTATRDFYVVSWNVQPGQGIDRNKSLARIRPSTLFHGEVIIFPKGTTAQVPFLKNALAIPKRLVNEVVGGYITTVMNERDAGREPPAQLPLAL